MKINFLKSTVASKRLMKKKKRNNLLKKSKRGPHKMRKVRKRKRNQRLCSKRDSSKEDMRFAVSVDLKTMNHSLAMRNCNCKQIYTFSTM